LTFTFYISVYGFSNLIGHVFKIAAFYLVYKALVETGLKRPYDLVFRDLKRREAELRKVKEELETTVAERTEELRVANEQLRLDLAERRRTWNALKESEKKLRYLSTQLLSAQEMERKSMAREIHDGLGQSLSLIKFRIEVFLREMGNRGTQEGVEKLQSLIPIIQGSVEEARRIQTGLRPSMLDDLGILATLSWFCREFEKTYVDIRVDKQVDIEEDDIPDPLKTTIYRVMQEAMNNIAKHSKANLIQLSLKAADGRVELTIQDNGQGFDLERALSSVITRKGFGLTSMTERAELTGGFISIESGKGAGTIIRIAWPIEKTETA
jgi:signal transduction histidine kinase